MYAPARSLIDKGAVVTLAPDFNAGSHLCFSMQMAGSLGVLTLQMKPEEVITATTLHGAYALGVSQKSGSIHPGKQADLILLEGKDYRETFYYFETPRSLRAFLFALSRKAFPSFKTSRAEAAV